MNLARAVTARSVVSCLLGLFLLAGCSNPGQVTPARPQPRGHTAQALSLGYSGTATFDVPVVDPNTWQGTPIGTGTWSTTATPPQSGGPAGIGFYDNQSGQLGHFLMIGNFSASGNFFGIVSDGAVLALGTSTINNTTLYAGIFDAATGDPVALASSGTLTLTAAGTIGGRITGTFTGTLDDVTPTPGCTSSAQCGSNEQCVSGRCVPQGCTSNAQCGSGQVCVTGQCVTPGCTSNAQCGAGQVCQGGVCLSTGCTSNAQCGAGQVCQGGVCLSTGCTSTAQCGSGQVCQSGQCVTATVLPCDGRQGDGTYGGKTGNTSVCSAFVTTSVNVQRAFAAIGDDGQGLALFVMDPLQTSAGAVLPLAACPSGPGTVAVTGATFWEQTSSGGVTFYAVRPATTASVTWTVVGGSLEGTFSMTLVGGHRMDGTFLLK